MATKMNLGLLLVVAIVEYGCESDLELDSAGDILSTSSFLKDAVVDNGSVPVRIYGTRRKGSETLFADKVVQIIQEQFELDRKDTPYAGVDVRVVYNDFEQPAHLVAYLKHKDSYLAEVVKIVLDDYRVVSVEKNYAQPQSDLYQAGDYAERAVCPDPNQNYDIVFGTFNTEIPTAVEGINTVFRLAQSYGLRPVQLIGTEASVTAYQNWLACKHIKGLGNIGHGNTYGIVLDGGMLDSSYFSLLPSDSLSPKILFFNSCQVHNEPFLSSVLLAGASRFGGGILNLKVGIAQKVFICFWNQAMKTKSSDLEQIMRDCEVQVGYPVIEAYGMSGNGPMPWDVVVNGGELGSTCSKNEECKSGFCASGVCCASDCREPCHSCNLPNSLGSCQPVMDSTPCADNDLCNGAETCQAGVCTPGVALVCQGSNPCMSNTCNPSKGCLNASLPDGSSCGNCLTCQSGSCIEKENCVEDEGSSSDDASILSCQTLGDQNTQWRALVIGLILAFLFRLRRS